MTGVPYGHRDTTEPERRIQWRRVRKSEFRF